MTAPHSVSVVIPVYNGGPSLPDLVSRVTAMSAASPDLDVIEIILVDDASPDNSWAVIEDLAEHNPVVRGVALARNFGQHAALLAGILETSADVIVTMDDDLQHLPEEIPRLVAGLTPGVDLAYGRSIKEEHGAYRNVSSRFAKWAVSAAAGSEVAKLTSGFRAFRGWLRTGLAQRTSPYVSLDVILSWMTDRIVPVPVEMQQRQHGQSNYTFGRLLRYALTMLFGFSTVPLRLVSYLGLIVGGLGGIMFIWVVVQYLLPGSHVPGFAFLASAIAVFSGVQLVSLGILGEYVARLYSGSLGHPPFVERERTTERGGAGRG
jgi:undecaprenyl-phosphate 4-deoxy-4-formamido-L-arabinose transferase